VSGMTFEGCSTYIRSYGFAKTAQNKIVAENVFT